MTELQRLDAVVDARRADVARIQVALDDLRERMVSGDRPHEARAEFIRLMGEFPAAAQQYKAAVDAYKAATEGKRS